MLMVLTTAKLHSTRPELRFCVGLSPARGVSEIRDGEDLVTFTEKILNGKLHFLCSGYFNIGVSVSKFKIVILKRQSWN